MVDGYNPKGVWPSNGRPLSQGVIAGEGEVIHVTGQVAWDKTGTIVGVGDVEAQMEQCIENIRVILAEVGGTLDDVVSLTIYFVDRAHLPAIGKVRARHFKADNGPAGISLMVAGLVTPDLLVEVVPIAVVPKARFKRPTIG
jgi:enamine deaminase RidA (YjgF/YER057c/UK114 family)